MKHNIYSEADTGRSDHEFFALYETQRFITVSTEAQNFIVFVFRSRVPEASILRGYGATPQANWFPTIGEIVVISSSTADISSREYKILRVPKRGEPIIQ
jgi:hypothetical protein